MGQTLYKQCKHPKIYNITITILDIIESWKRVDINVLHRKLKTIVIIALFTNRLLYVTSSRC